MKDETLLPEERDAKIDDLRVKLGASARQNFGKRSIQTQRGTIGTMRRHRLHHVRNGENPSLKRDLIVLEVVRIAGTIQTLMMLQYHGQNHWRQVHFLRDVIAVFRVRLQNLILQVRDFAGLVEDVGCNIDFPDVVNQRAIRKVGDLLLRHAAAQADFAGKLLDAPLMPGGVNIPELADLGDGVDGLLQPFWSTALVSSNA